MPLPLIPIAIGIATAAGVGLQAYDTFKDKPITIMTQQPKPQPQKPTNFLPLVIIGAVLIIGVVALK